VHSAGGAATDALAERPQHAGDVGGPARDGLRGQLARVDVQDRLVLGGAQAETVGGGACRGREAAVRDRHREAQAVLIVDVLPDDVDAAGGGPHAVGLVPVGLLEQRGRPVCGLAAVRRRGEHGDGRVGGGLVGGGRGRGGGDGGS